MKTLRQAVFEKDVEENLKQFKMNYDSINKPGRQATTAIKI